MTPPAVSPIPTVSPVTISGRTVGTAPLSPGSTATEAVAWAVERFGSDLCLLTSAQDAVLVDVALRVDPRMEVVFIDTGYHFDETINTMMAIAERYQLRLRVVVPWRHLSGAGQRRFCCSDHKVEQLDFALSERRAWLSGLRRADGPTRADAPMVELDRRGLVKVNPLIAWSDEEVRAYEQRHDIIVNPLREQGYPSIGCKPCTGPATDGDDARSGRWAGTEKTECGLHL